MSWNRKRSVMRHPMLVDTDCSCRRPKFSYFFASSAFQPKLQPPNSPHPCSPSTTTHTSTSHWETSLTASATNFSSPSTSESPKKRREGTTKKKSKLGKSVAVVVESADPYKDFRESMLVMIVEEEIYTWEDLRELLHRFLFLNAPAHHHLILRAFSDICSSVFSPSTPSPSHPSPRPRARSAPRQ